LAHLLEDVIDEHLKHSKSKRSWKDNDRHGEAAEGAVSRPRARGDHDRT
jgi:hypothetical protein